MRGYARLCVVMRGYARLCAVMRGYARFMRGFMASHINSFPYKLRSLGPAAPLRARAKTLSRRLRNRPSNAQDAHARVQSDQGG